MTETYDIDPLLRALDRAAAVQTCLNGALKLLRTLEWTGADAQGKPYCLLCGGDPPFHKPCCPLDAVLAGPVE